MKARGYLQIIGQQNLRVRLQKQEHHQISGGGQWNTTIGSSTSGAK
jgi:hypothetical protein